MKRIIRIVLLIILSSSMNVLAADDYLPITYNVARYNQGGEDGTTIWYSVIPAKYKMHYAYGQDKINLQEKPSENAVRHNATLAINAQYMGLVDYNGTLLDTTPEKNDVSKYDFYMNPNTDDSSSNTAHLYAVSKTSTKIGINLAYAKNPVWKIGMCFVTMYRDGNRVHEDENNLPADTYSNLVNNRHPRTWIVIDSEGTQYVAVATGRNLNSNPPQVGLTFDEIVDATKKILTTDIKYLFNLDGGSSSSFVYHGTMLNPKLYKETTESEYEERIVRGIYYWKVDNYKIEYDLDGGKLQNNLKNPTKYNVDTTGLTLNNPKKEGYQFTGWIETIDGEKNNTPKKSIVISGNKIGNRKYVATYQKINNDNEPETNTNTNNNNNNNNNNSNNNSTNANNDTNTNAEVVKVNDTFATGSNFSIIIGIILLMIGSTLITLKLKNVQK